MLPYYEIMLPMPTSINAAHEVGKRKWNPKTRKFKDVVRRSDAYNDWEQRAAVVYRNAFPGGVQHLTGRLAVYYIFIWNKEDRGHISSDVANREKCLTDFLEHKFFENDKAIDEQHMWRRIVEIGQSRVVCRIYAIPDRRYDDVDLIFNPKPKD